MMTLVLLLAAAVLCMTGMGTDYLGYACAFFALVRLLARVLPQKLRRSMAVLLCLGLMYFCLVELPITAAARGDNAPGKKYLIVLGAAVYGETPSLSLVRRCEGAAEYLKENPETVCIVSGGMGNAERIPESEAMERLLLASGIPAERIVQEAASRSTLENLRNSFAIIEERGDTPDGEVAIVSSSYHLYRAKAMAHALGAEAVGVPCPPGHPSVMLNYFIREAFGITHLWVFGS